MSFQIDPPKITALRRRTYQSIILSEDGDSRFEARFLRQSLMQDANGKVLFTIDDPDPIVIRSEELANRPDLISAVMLIQQEVDARDRDRLNEQASILPA